MGVYNLGCDFFSPNKYAEGQSGTDVLGWHLLVFFCLRGFFAALHLQIRKYEKDLTTLDNLLSKILSKIDTSHLSQ